MTYPLQTVVGYFLHDAAADKQYVSARRQSRHRSHMSNSSWSEHSV